MLKITNNISNKYIIFLIILLLGEIGYVATDIYLPSLPALADSFNSTAQAVKLTITIYLFSFGFFQLIYGPVSDNYGRRITVLIGLVIAVVASFVCVFATSMHMLYAARFFQGIGMAAGTVMARAIMCDLYSGVALARASSYYTIIASQIITAMPILGGVIQSKLGWRWNFALVLLYSILCLLLVVKFLPETNQSKYAYSAKVKNIIINYFKLLAHKTFIVNVLCSSLALSGIFIFAIVSSFLLQNVLHLSPIEYGWLSLVSCVAFILGGILNSKTVVIYGVSRMLGVGAILMLLGGMLMLIPSIFGFISVFLLMLPVFVFVLGCNFVFANTAVLALAPFAEMLGLSGALYGSIQLIFTALTTSLVALLHATDQMPLASILVILGIIEVGLYYCYIRE